MSLVDCTFTHSFTRIMTFKTVFNTDSKQPQFHFQNVYDISEYILRYNLLARIEHIESAIDIGTTLTP